ncbi:MAG: NAD-dependent epimerase/dehydratase family protein [Gallionellaceae bacterium]|nr:NAD-dependent epimerase/dehydratase family protein [Gallionellaceae bacterium]
MKIAVTGASGFVGQHVLVELLRHKIEIVAVTRDAARLSGVSPSVKVIEMNIAHPTPDCFEHMGSPDVLIHLAWDGLPNYKSLHHFETELPRQYAFLKAMVEAGLPALLVTGTCFEYGMQSGPLSENMPTKPGNPYGYAKDTLRQQLELLKSSKPFNLTWARLFYMYGSGQPNTSLYPKLKEAALRGDKVFNMSGGEQLRDYLPVTEVARQIVRLAVSGGDVGIINICSGKPISVRNLVEQWLRENSWEIEFNFGYYPYPDYEPMAFWGDTSLMRQRFTEEK